MAVSEHHSHYADLSSMVFGASYSLDDVCILTGSKSVRSLWSSGGNTYASSLSHRWQGMLPSNFPERPTYIYATMGGWV